VLITSTSISMPKTTTAITMTSSKL